MSGSGTASSHRFKDGHADTFADASAQPVIFSQPQEENLKMEWTQRSMGVHMGGNEGIQVGVVMGSDSDYPVMKEAADVLKTLGIPHEVFIVSAHRTPHRMVAYALTAQDRGLDILIAGAGGAAHLPGMVASLTCLPVIGVPVRTKALDGLDSFLSIVQMPAGVPVATVPVNGGAAAGLLAAKMIGLSTQDI